MRRSEGPRGFSCCRTLWLGILLLGFVLPVSLGAGEGAPVDRVRDTLEGAMDILRDPALQGPDKEAARKQKVRKLIAAGFNYTEMAARSLGSHWDKLTRKQRQGFVDLFGDLFEISYSQMVLESLPDRQTMYTGESVNRPRAVVNTVIVDARGDRLPVDYQVQCPHGQWELIDVVIDGVSIVRVYRSQFNKVIRTSSFDALVKKMRVKRDEQ